MPAKKTWSSNIHPPHQKKPTRTLLHNFRPSWKRPSFYFVWMLIGQRKATIASTGCTQLLLFSFKINKNFNSPTVSPCCYEQHQPTHQGYKLINRKQPSQSRRHVTVVVLPFQKDPCLCGGVYSAHIQMDFPRKTVRLDAWRNASVCLRVCFFHVAVCTCIWIYGRGRALLRTVVLSPSCFSLCDLDSPTETLWLVKVDCGLWFRNYFNNICCCLCIYLASAIDYKH